MSEGGRTGSCPSCGGPIEFKLGSSRACICPWCSHSVVRTTGGLESIGKVADLVPTAPMMAVGDSGTLRGEPFVVGGRLQLDHGRGPWDEWYVELPGRRTWGWLAKAQGKLYLTFPVEAQGLPALERMMPGTQGALPGTGETTWVVTERGESRLVSAEGELPFAAKPGAHGRYVDLVAAGGGFATLDYGDGSEAPQLYAGRELAASEFVLRETGVGPRPEQRVDVGKLTCPTCGAPVPIKVPEATERAVCAACDSLLDFAHGQLAFLERLSQPRVVPYVPLGAEGTLRGKKLLCVGFMERATVSGGETYAWREYLLHADDGFHWLVEDAGHFLLVSPASAAEVETSSRGVTYRGRSYRLFQRAQPVVRYVLGEFTWKVSVGERSRAADYVSPPYALSEETSETEIVWSHGEYVPGEEVRAGFGLRPRPPRAYGVAPAQPNPAKPLFGTVFAAIATMLLLVVFAALGPTVSPLTLVDGPVSFPPRQDEAIKAAAGASPAPTTPSADNDAISETTFTVPFELPPTHPAIELELSAAASGYWLGVACALIHKDDGEVRELALELDQLYRSGETTATATIGDLEPGAYTLRLESRWAADGAKVIPRAQLTARAVSGRGRSPGCCFFAVLLLWLPALVSMGRRAAFETRRWSESDHA